MSHDICTPHPTCSALGLDVSEREDHLSGDFLCSLIPGCLCEMAMGARGRHFSQCADRELFQGHTVSCQQSLQCQRSDGCISLARAPC